MRTPVAEASARGAAMDSGSEVRAAARDLQGLLDRAGEGAHPGAGRGAVEGVGLFQLRGLLHQGDPHPQGDRAEADPVVDLPRPPRARLGPDAARSRPARRRPSRWWRSSPRPRSGARSTPRSTGASATRSGTRSGPSPRCARELTRALPAPGARARPHRGAPGSAGTHRPPARRGAEGVPRGASVRPDPGRRARGRRRVPGRRARPERAWGPSLAGGAPLRAPGASPWCGGLRRRHRRAVGRGRCGSWLPGPEPRTYIGQGARSRGSVERWRGHRGLCWSPRSSVRGHALEVGKGEEGAHRQPVLLVLREVAARGAQAHRRPDGLHLRRVHQALQRHHRRGGRAGGGQAARSRLPTPPRSRPSSTTT